MDLEAFFGYQQAWYNLYYTPVQMEHNPWMKYFLIAFFSAYFSCCMVHKKDTRKIGMFLG